MLLITARMRKISLPLSGDINRRCLILASVQLTITGTNQVQVLNVEYQLVLNAKEQMMELDLIAKFDVVGPDTRRNLMSLNLVAVSGRFNAAVLLVLLSDGPKPQPC